MTAAPLSPDRITELRSQEALTVSEAAALVRVGRRAIYGLIRRGAVPAIKVGTSYRIPTYSFLAFLDRGDPTLIDGRDS